MIKNKFTTIASLCIFITSILFYSCNDSEIIPNADSDGIGTLNIWTRTNPEQPEVPLPIHIFIFNSKQICIYNTIVTSLGSKISAELPTGSYSVSILAGADPKVYNIADKKTATLTSEITLREGQTSHQRIAMAQANVTLNLNELTNLEVDLTHLVAQTSAVIKKLPEDALAVNLSIGNLYSSFCLNGSFKGTNGSSNMICVQDKASGDWTTSGVYTLPSYAQSVPITVKVLQSNGATDIYKYTSNSIPQANKAFQIAATYANTGTFALGVKCNSWGTPISETFNFDDKNVETDILPEITSASLPAKYDLWEGAFVVDVSNVTSNSATLLLMSIHEWSDLTIAEIESQAKAYTAAGGKGWMVPTDFQADAMRTARKSIGIRQFDLLLKSATGDEISPSGYNLCKFWATGLYGRYSFASTGTSDVDNTAKLRLRAIKRIKINF